MKLSSIYVTATLMAPMVNAFGTRAWLDRKHRRSTDDPKPAPRRVIKRDATGSPFVNGDTAKFVVDGRKIPEVGFDIGESYAGQLPVGNGSNGQFFFWFFPTTNADQPKEILIRLAGGPGCSALASLTQEDGPFLWQVGTYHPVPNPWSYHHLTNVLYVEQPIGTGFSTGTVTISDNDEMADQFAGFWRNFVDTFRVQGYKIYITGESYAGFYVPYIASNFLDRNDTNYFNVKGISLADPVIGDYNVEQYIPAVDFIDYWAPQFPFNDTFASSLKSMSAKCGYDEYMDKYLVFPAAGQQPVQTPGPYYANGSFNEDSECLTWDNIFDSIQVLNPGWNEYLVTEVPPVPYDILGFPTALMYLPPGVQAYFNRTDVKQAIHAPMNVNWSVCTEGDVYVNGTDKSLYSMIHAIPNVIEKTQNVIIAHGQNDFILLDSGTLMNIQNTSWGGKRGFSCMPDSPLFVPYHNQADNFRNITGDAVETLAAMGVTGTYHTERGLTFAHITLAGHLVAAYQPATTFRLVEFLLGRVDSLSSNKPLSNYPDVAQPDPRTFGKGVARKLGKGVSCSNMTANGSGRQ